MKKRTHRILSWLLTIAMMLGLLPAMSLPAAAVTTISEIVITGLDAPVAGATPDETFTIETAGVSLYDENWGWKLATGGYFTGNFAANTQYAAYFDVLAGGDYAFTSDVTATVSGYPATVEKKTDYDDNPYWRVTCEFPATEGEGINVSRDGASDSGDGWTWDQANSKLTMTNYAGGPIYIGGATAGAVEIELVGTNSATVSRATGEGYCAGVEVVNASTVTVTGKGTLKVDVTAADSAISKAYGIYLKKDGVTAFGGITFSGGKVTAALHVSGSDTAGYGIFSDGSNGSVAVDEGAELWLSPGSSVATNTMCGIYTSGSVYMDGTATIQFSTGSGNAESPWTSISVGGQKTITIGANAAVTVTMPSGCSTGMESALLEANGGAAVGTWTNTSGIYRYFENDSCLVTLSSPFPESGETVYEDYKYEAITPLTFEDSAAYDIPAGTAGTGYTADTAFTAGGGSGDYVFTIDPAVDGLSIDSGNHLAYTRPATAQEATTATVKVTDKGGYSKTITIDIGAVTEAAVSEDITITSYTGNKSLSNGWSYVKDTNTLTLNGYQGGGISASGMSTLTLVLEGTNVINGDVGAFATGIDCLCNLTIKGSGSLTINSIQTEMSKHARAVSAYTITQDGGNVTVNVESVYWHHALRAQTGIYLNGGKLTVNATDKNPSAAGGSQLVYTDTGEILVEEDAELTVNVTNQSSACADIAVYNAASATTDPTNNGDITIRGKVTITRTKDSHSTGGAVNGIITASTQKNTDGVITISDGADVTITDTEYAIVSNAPEAESQSDIKITGGTVNITSGIFGSVGLRSKCNGISITGGTVNVHTDSSALDMDYADNKNGIIRIGGSAVVNLTSDNSYAVKTCDTASSARVHRMDFSDGGSFTAKSNEPSYQSYPVQAYFQLGTNTYLSEGIASGYNEAGTGRKFSSGTLNRVKVSYKQANAHPDLGAVKINGCYFHVSTLYYKNDASGTYDGADEDWNAHYNPNTGVLELKNYAGGPIEIGGANPTVVELKLTGANTITANQPNITGGNYCAGVKIANADTVTVTGTGSLTVNVNAGGDIWFAHGIYLDSTSNALSDLTIQSGTVDLNIQYTSSSTAPYAVGIYTGETGNKSGKVTVGADAAVHAAVTSGQSGSFAKGIWAKGDVALNGETSLRLTCSGTGSPNNNWTSVTTNGSVTIGVGASVSVDMPNGRGYGLSNALLAADGGTTVSSEGWNYDSSGYGAVENGNFRMVVTDRSGSLYADFDYMSKSGATAVEGITVTAADTALSANGTTTVTAAVTPKDATYPGVLWSSSHPNVTVDTYGKVTAGLEVQTNPGKAVLTATSKYDTSVTGSTAITVGTLDSSKIYEVFAQVPAPVVDVTPATAEEVTVDAGFSVHNVTWYYWNESDSAWNTFTGAFEAGKLYRVNVDIRELSDTKDYADFTRMAAYINGKAVPISGGNSSTGVAYVYCTFGKAAAASSGGGIPDANFVTVDGGKPFADLGKLCFKNGEADTGTSSSDYNAKYDPSTGVLELRNYNGGPIEIGGNVEADITIKLVGANVITSSGQFGIVNHHGGDITITADSDATLTINVTNTAQEAIGIACDRTESYPGCSRAITIGGKARVTVNATSTDTRDIMTAAGLRTPGTVTIRDGASFQAVCKSATPSIGVQAGVGILAYKGVTIDTTGTVEIDVSQCTSIGTFAIYGSAANALTKVGSMTLKWKQSGVDGGMLYPAGSFDSAAATHAVNVDTANRVATYRFGTPYTVTVNNGSCDAVGRRYLEGDTVTVTAGTIEGLEFTKWTSEQVASFSPSNTSSTATFTMPAQDVTVTADFGAFAVPPVFTLTGEGTGNIAFTMVKAPSNSPKLVQAGSEEVYKNFYFSYDINYSCSLNFEESDIPGGEYQIAVPYDGTWLYSDVFTVSYAGTPQATVKNTTVSGTRGEALMNPVEVVISLKFDTFQNVAVNDDVGSWFTNLPAGLAAGINYVSWDMKFVSITISGTPTKVKDEAMAITIPAGKLTISETDLTVTANPEAKFEIAESPNVLTKFELSAALNGLKALASCGSITAAPEEAHSDKYDIIVLSVTPEAELGTADVADPGEQLKLTVGVAAKEPYLLEDADLDSLIIRVGGHKAEPKTIHYEDGYAHESVKKNGVWYWKFVVPEAFTVPAYTFSNITFTIDPAETGTSPSSTVAVQNGTEAPGSKLNTSVEWTDLGTSGTDSTAMSASNTFQNGHYYECRVKFTSTDTTNYKFPGANVGMTITANGKTIPETMSNPYESPLVSCFAYGIDGETGSACYTVYLRFNIGNGSTVSGTVTSYGDSANTVTVKLMQGATIVDTWSGTGNSVDYSFATVPAGDYTLEVSKTGHATYTEDISVDSVAVTCNLTIYLLGDVDLSGNVDVNDVNIMRQYLVGNLESLSDRQLAIFDVTQDDATDIADPNQILQYLVGNRASIY